jgi:hypothetical protein
MHAGKEIAVSYGFLRNFCVRRPEREFDLSAFVFDRFTANNLVKIRDVMGHGMRWAKEKKAVSPSVLYVVCGLSNARTDAMTVFTSYR